MNFEWVYYTKAVDNNLIDTIVENGLGADLDEAKIFHNEEVVVQPEYRRSQMTFMDDSYVTTKLYSIVNIANDENFGFDISSLQTPQFAKYDEKDKGHYSWHIDTSWVTNAFFHRKLTMVVQLSDPSEYEGGDFEIHTSGATEEQLIEMKQKGSVIVFPSFLEHRVTPVTKGRRMSMTSWVTGPKFR